MATNDTCCTILPYFQVQPGQLPAFKKLVDQLVEQTRPEPGCLYYGFSFAGDLAFCQEGYRDAEALIAHVKNVSAILKEALQIAKIVRLEIHGPAGELPKIRAALTKFDAQYFTLEYGFRR